MATKRIKWFQQDGTLLHPETDWDSVVNKPSLPSTYTLPQATNSELGGIKIGATGLSSKQYPLLLNTTGQAYVSVPWTDNDTHNTAYLYLATSASSATQTSGTISDPYLNLVDGGTRRTSIHLIGGTGVTISAGGTNSISRTLTINGFSGSYNDLTDKPKIPTIPSISISNSGSGNAVTSITASGHAVTVTKGSTFATTATASSSANGLMSSTDKSHLDSMWNVWASDGTTDTLVNKVEEVLAAFASFKEGDTIIELLSKKADESDLALYVKKAGDEMTGALRIGENVSEKNVALSENDVLFTESVGIGGSRQTRYGNGTITHTEPLGSELEYTLPETSGTLLVDGDLTWDGISNKPSWIGSSKPSYSWTEISSKPTWIGNTKPSYSWSEINSKPTWIGATKPSYTWTEIGSKPAWIGSSKPTYSYSEISGTPTLADVATSGSYTDLKDTPVIPSVDNVVTIDTTQTITGVKTFDDHLYVSDGEKHAEYSNAGITVKDDPERTAFTYKFPTKGGTFLVDSDLAWDKLSGKPTWIGSNKPSYTWTEIGGKPTWIGSNKPSYSYSEISGTPTSLKNPYGLSITVNGSTTTYDGSATRSVNISTSGGSNEIRIRVHWLQNIRVNGEIVPTSLQGLRAEIEIVSGKELLLPTDEIVLAQTRKRNHRNKKNGNRRYDYKYRAEDKRTISELTFQKDNKTVVNFETERLTANNTHGNSGQPTFQIFIRRGGAKRDDFVHISNSVCFYVIHRTDLARTRFLITGN